MIQQKYIFLDRDGVINIDSNEYIKTVDEWEPLPRSIEAIKRLSDNNYQIIIIKISQPDRESKIITYS